MTKLIVVAGLLVVVFFLYFMIRFLIALADDLTDEDDWF